MALVTQAIVLFIIVCHHYLLGVMPLAIERRAITNKMLHIRAAIP